MDAGTNLTITAPNSATPPVMATITAPAITAGESVSDYATALQGALAAAGIPTTGPGAVTVTASATGQLSISGAGVSVSGSVIQDPVAANATGTLNFAADGSLVTPSSNVSGITFSGLSDGAASMDMTWNLFGSNGASEISQVAATSSVTPTTQNGYPSGTYNGFTIGSDGTVTASFSNGNNLNVGQIALGTVANLQGLQANGNGEYSTTLSSARYDRWHIGNGWPRQDGRWRARSLERQYLAGVQRPHYRAARL